MMRISAAEAWALVLACRIAALAQLLHEEPEDAGSGESDDDDELLQIHRFKPR
jgi:hypothetical protein